MDVHLPDEQIDFGRKWHEMAVVSSGASMLALDDSVANDPLPTPGCCLND